MAYTFDDLERAKRELAVASERAANHRANNPDYGQADIRSAAREVRAITESLKADGILPLTEKEKLYAELDKLFPNARSKEVVEFRGKRFQRRFYPAEKSLSGKTVREWDKWWEEIKEDE